MKMKNKKIFTISSMIISIINIICLICGYIFSSAGNHSFNASLSPSTYNITILFLIVLILQLVNIILLVILQKKNLTNKQQKQILISVFSIIIITLLIPVKGTNAIKYTHPTSKKNNIIDLSTIGATTDIKSYKNLYGLTLKNSEDTSLGIRTY